MLPDGSLATADLVVLAVALPLVVALGAVAVTTVAPAVALGLASLPSAGTVGYALFYDPPADAA